MGLCRISRMISRRLLTPSGSTSSSRSSRKHDELLACRQGEEGWTGQACMSHLEIVGHEVICSFSFSTSAPYIFPSLMAHSIIHLRKLVSFQIGLALLVQHKSAIALEDTQHCTPEMMLRVKISSSDRSSSLSAITSSSSKGVMSLLSYDCKQLTCFPELLGFWAVGSLAGFVAPHICAISSSLSSDSSSSSSLCWYTKILFQLTFLQHD